MITKSYEEYINFTHSHKHTTRLSQHQMKCKNWYAYTVTPTSIIIFNPKLEIF